MRLIDEQYLKTPFYGYRKMTEYLRQVKKQPVNRKRVQRLMQLMGLRAVGPTPKTSLAGSEHKIYPYLLRDVTIDRVNQVWSADITYLPMAQGFLYLVAILDWYSRYVLAWQVSNSLDGHFCASRLRRSLAASKAGDFQHRPRRAIHRQSLHPTSGSGWRPGQYGWPGPGLRQYLHRTLVAYGQV